MCTAQAFGQKKLVLLQTKAGLGYLSLRSVRSKKNDNMYTFNYNMGDTHTHPNTHKNEPGMSFVFCYSHLGVACPQQARTQLVFSPDNFDQKAIYSPYMYTHMYVYVYHASIIGICAQSIEAV